MNQVHKETLSHVENALPNRQGLDVEIFGVEGMPEDVRKQHEERIVKNYFDAQRERFEATGNPPPGEGRPQKKIRVESAEELKKRFAEFRAKKAAAKAAGIPFTGVQNPAVPANVQSPAQAGSPGTFVSSLLVTLIPKNDADFSSGIPFQPAPAIWSARSTRLSRLPSQRRSTTGSLQPLPSSIRLTRSTTLPPQCTKPATAAGLPLPWPSASRLPCRWRIHSGRAGGRRSEARR